MLGKLIKHELRGSGRTMLPFILVSLALSVMAGFSVRAMERQQDYSWFTAVFTIVIMLFVVGLIAVCVMSLVVVIERFRKNLLGDEGYLMFTLPVTVDAHIFSKLIVSFIWFVATWLVCMLAMLLMLACNIRTFDIDWAVLGNFISELWRAVKDFGVFHIIGYVVEFLLVFFAGSCFTCLHFYCAMAVGYSFSNKKGLLSVVAFFAINVAINLIQSTGLLSMTNVHFDLDLSTAAAIHMGLLIVLLYLVFWSAVLYLPTRLLLKKKLNLP